MSGLWTWVTFTSEKSNKHICPVFFYTNMECWLLVQMMLSLLLWLLLLLLLSSMWRMCFCTLSLKSPAGQWHTVFKSGLNFIYVRDSEWGRGICILETWLLFFLFKKKNLTKNLEFISNEINWRSKNDSFLSLFLFTLSFLFFLNMVLRYWSGFYLL